MKIFSKFAIFAALGAMMTACFSETKSKVEYLSFTETKNGKHGFIKPDGTTLYSDEFDATPTSIIDGCFVVSEGAGYSIYKATDKKPTLIKGLEDLQAAGGFSDGLIPVVKKNERIQVVNTSGKTVFTFEPVNGKEVVSCDPMFHDGILPFKLEDDKWGAVNEQGKVVIEPKFYIIFSFSEGYALAKKGDDSDAPYVVIDKKGEVMFKFKNSWDPYTYVFGDGYMVVKDDSEHLMFVSPSGESKKCPNKVKGISDYNKDLLLYSNEDGNRGVMSMKDFEVLIRPKYDACRLLPWSSSEVLVKKDDEISVVDLDGNTKIDWDDDYDFILPYEMADFQGYVASEGDEFFFLNKKGEKIKPKKSVDIYNLSDMTLMNGTINSDYFNVENFVATIANMIGAGELNGFQVGSYVNKLFSSNMEPRNWLYNYTFFPENSNVEGFRYSIYTKLCTSRPIAYSEYTPSYYGGYYYGDTDYRFSPDNAIDEVQLNISAVEGIYDLTKADFKSVMKEKGYSLERSDSDLATFVKGTCQVTFSGSGDNLTVTMTDLERIQTVEVEEVAECDTVLCE